MVLKANVCKIKELVEQIRKQLFLNLKFFKKLCFVLEKAICVSYCFEGAILPLYFLLINVCILVSYKSLVKGGKDRVNDNMQIAIY